MMKSTVAYDSSRFSNTARSGLLELLEPLDQRKLDEAVQFINQKTILTGLELARVIGRYVLETFFNGDYQSFADTSRSKKSSFRALLKREDLLLSNATLSRFVRISYQLRTLPPDLAPNLSLAHHRALLSLRDPDKKTELAQRALDESWSSRRLVEEVRRLLPKSRAGRKPLPASVKAIHRIVKATQSDLDQRIDPEEIRQLNPQQIEELATQVRESLAHLTALKEKLDAICNSHSG